MNGNAQTNSQQEPNGIIDGTLAWLMHPLNSPYLDPMNWVAFVIGMFVLGMFWRMIVRQVLDVA